MFLLLSLATTYSQSMSRQHNLFTDRVFHEPTVLSVCYDGKHRERVYSDSKLCIQNIPVMSKWKEIQFPMDAIHLLDFLPVLSAVLLAVLTSFITMPTQCLFEFIVLRQRLVVMALS